MKFRIKSVIGLVVVFVFIIISAFVFMNFGYREMPNSLICNNSEKDCVRYYQTHWADSFLEYFETHDMKQKVKNLKKGMDNVSISYIDQYMKNSKYFDRCINLCRHYSEDKLWNSYDKKLLKDFAKLPLPEFYERFGYDPYIWHSLYGMKDLPDNILEKINGRDIIDIGAYPGDTVYTFHKYFPQSHIFAFEPVLETKEKIDQMVDELKKEDDNYKLIHTIQKGVSDRNYSEKQMEWAGYVSPKVPIVSIDDYYDKIGNNNVGLIKMDIEGAESSAIKGAINTIKKYKPVLVISIYHTPEDFFEMKDKISNINSEYKFIIRRSEPILADADLVLIAY